MRKNYFFAVTLVAAALTGCSQDELVDYNPEVKSDFTATLETVESRTTLDANNKVQWVVNEDHVSLFEMVDINAKYKVNGVDNNGTATLKYVSHIEKDDYQTLDKYYAVYPYSDNNSIASDGTITAEVPAAYTYKDKESCIASALMVASSDNKSMRFTNAQGIIRLRINAVTPYTWGKIQSVTFTSKANYLNGTATMSWDTTTPSAKITSGQDENKTLTINLDESLKKDLPSKQSGNYAEYYVPVVPTKFEAEDLTMVVTFANNKTYSKAIPADFTVGRKEIIGLKHSIGADDFTADIEDEVVSDEISNEEQLIKALKAGGKFTLLADITLNEGVEIPEGKVVTLNLNGKNINTEATYDDSKAKASSAIVNNGTLTLTGNGSIKATNNYTVRNYGTMTIDGTTIENGIMNFSNLTVESGNISNSRTGKHTIYGNNATLTINGGTFYNGNPGNAAIFSYAGEVTINAGEFSIADGTSTLGWTSCLIDAQDNATYTLNGGTIKGEIRDYNKNTTIYGGTYTNKTSVDSFIADGYTYITNSDGTYTVMKGDVAVSNINDLITAINDGQTNIALAPGSYDMPIGTDNVNLQGKTLTINGTKDVIINTANVNMNDQYVTNANLTFDGVTLNFGTTIYMGFANTANLTYKNCAINGLQFVCGTGKVVFENCDLNSNGAEHSLWTWGISDISFTGCDFTYDDRAINCYAEHGQTTNATFTNCTFTKVAGKETTGAIETNSSLMTALNLSINNCTVNEGDLWWVSTWDSNSGANTFVTENGKVTVANAAQLAAVVSKGNTEIYLLDGEYDVNGCANKELTLNGSRNAILVVTGGEQNEAGGLLDYGFDSSKITFNGLTIQTAGGVYSGYARLTGTYNDCAIVNNYSLNGVSKFTECTFTTTGDNYNIWTWGAKEAEFNKCIFNCDGKSILVYNQSCNLTVNTCTFNDNGTISNKAAIEVCNGDNGDNCVTHNIVINNTTVNGFDINPNGVSTNSTLWANKNSLDDAHLNVTIDGTIVY